MDGNSCSDNNVPLDLLRERAFNLRWAQQPADVIPLTAADPDFPICQAIQEHLIRYVREGVMSYAPPEGLPHFARPLPIGCGPRATWNVRPRKCSPPTAQHP